MLSIRLYSCQKREKQSTNKDELAIITRKKAMSIQISSYSKSIHKRSLKKLNIFHYKDKNTDNSHSLIIQSILHSETNKTIKT
ncbi:hypothetical protein EG347_10840 [Chryseobacterium sp. G0186]|nr:hypothetical protein EG347_10840 [Chryseobacterium sp. G0186]